MGLLDRLWYQPNLHIVAGRQVDALLAHPGRAPRVAGVRCDDGSRFDGHSVVMAAGALTSPRLLRSWLDAAGLTGRIAGHDLIGRHYKSQLTTLVWALSPERKSDRARETLMLSNDEFPHSSVSTVDARCDVATGARLRCPLPRWLTDVARARAHCFRLTTEDGSHPDNRINGVAVTRPCLDYDPARVPAGLIEHRRLVRSFRLGLLRAGCLSVARYLPNGESGNACGTLLAGHDPSRSVVGPDGRVHGVENLHVADGSVLPRSGRVSQLLTIHAWGLRVGSRLRAH